MSHLVPPTPDTPARWRMFLEFAPTIPKNINPEVRGWWSPDGYYICVVCAARIIARGFGTEFRTCRTDWADSTEPVGRCEGCEYREEIL